MKDLSVLFLLGIGIYMLIIGLHDMSESEFVSEPTTIEVYTPYDIIYITNDGVSTELVGELTRTNLGESLEVLQIVSQTDPMHNYEGGEVVGYMRESYSQALFSKFKITSKL